jgi:hypothetical protein
MVSRNGEQVSAFGVKVPHYEEIQSVDPVIESMKEMAGRRDALRLIAEKANDEANKLDRELTRISGEQVRKLKSTQALIGAD